MKAEGDKKRKEKKRFAHGLLLYYGVSSTKPGVVKRSFGEIKKGRKLSVDELFGHKRIVLISALLHIFVTSSDTI